MAKKGYFSADPMSEEESIEIRDSFANSVRMEAKKKVEEVKSTWSAEKSEPSEKKERTKSKKKAASSKTADIENMIKESNIDYAKWANFKSIAIIKPEISLLEEEIGTVAIPVSLVAQLTDLSATSKKIFSKTIVSNLLVKFFEENKDIIELLKKESSKK